MELALDKLVIELSNSKREVRKLSDMKRFFSDRNAVDAILEKKDPVIYEFHAHDAGGPGDLSYAITIINPGDVGGEYFMTKGHFHKKDVAEVYLGLGGSGILLMQDKRGKSKRAQLKPGKMAYVPKGYAHRAINNGNKQLKFLAVYMSDSGHDYGTIEREGFKEIIRKQGL